MIKPLTSLRFFFAFMILLSHFSPIAGGVSLFPQGYIGVGFFFVLSGFVLAYSYQDRIENRKKDFYIARFARIYPLHLITFFIAFLVLFFKNRTIQLFDFFLNLFLLQSFNPGNYFTFNAVSWSISDEMFFYLLFPFLIKVSLSLSNKQKILFLGIIIVVYISLCNFIPTGKAYYLFYINPIFRMIEFFFGILLYQFWKKNVNTSDTKIKFTLLEIFSIMLVIVFTSLRSKLSNYIPEVYLFSIYYWIPMIILILVFAYSKGYLSDLLSCRPLVYLGEISFAFYLFHTLVRDAWFDLFGFHFSWQINFLGILIATIAVSAFSYKYIEKPSNKWIRKIRLNKKM